jgi:hypothetical protein
LQKKSYSSHDHLRRIVSYAGGMHPFELYFTKQWTNMCGRYAKVRNTCLFDKMVMVLVVVVAAVVVLVCVEVMQCSSSNNCK